MPDSKWDTQTFNSELNYLSDKMHQYSEKQLKFEDNLSLAKAKFETQFGFKEKFDEYFEKIIRTNLPIKKIKAFYWELNNEQIQDPENSTIELFNQIWNEMEPELKVYDRFKQSLLEVLYPNKT